MSKQWMAIVTGGLLPAVFHGRKGRHGSGSDVVVLGLVIAAVGGIVTLIPGDTAVTTSGAIQTAGYAILWSTAVPGVVLGPGAYEGPVSVIVPLYNTNTRVAVGIGLTRLGE